MVNMESDSEVLGTGPRGKFGNFWHPLTILIRQLFHEGAGKVVSTRCRRKSLCTEDHGNQQIRSRVSNRSVCH